MSEATNQAVFLSYASQDAEAVRRIADALRAAGVVVWFDQNELTGGDAWDAKIRGQIASCALFVPVISAATQARREGYFRIEWKLAAQRTHAIADGTPFLLPVVIDGTHDAEALVPAEFRAVQWTRLPAGETPEKFCARVKGLVAGEAGAAERAREQPPSRAGAKSEVAGSAVRAVNPMRVRSWPIAVGALLTLAAVSSVAFFAWPRAKDVGPGTKAGAAVTPAVAATAAPAVSEARQLVIKAWAVLKPELGRLELNTADELCKKAAALDPSDAEVWAVWAHVHTWYAHHNFDRSAVRYEAAADCASRAMQLAPTAYESRLAQAHQWLRGLPSERRAARREETERILRTLLVEKPDEPRALFALGVLLKYKPEGIALLERLAQNPASTAVAWVEIGWHYAYVRRYEEANRAADLSVAALPHWSNLSLKIFVALIWLGDAELALETLKRMPSAALQEDLGISMAMSAYFLGRKYPEQVKFLNGVSKEWLNSNAMVGPRAYFLGWTRLALGQSEAGLRDLQRGLEITEKRLADSPNDPALLAVKVSSLYYLGQWAEAEKSYRVLKEVDPARAMRETGVLFEKPDAVIDFLEKHYRAKNWQMTAASLRLDPYYDPIREHPRFQALQATLDADPLTSQVAAAKAARERK